VPRRLIRGGGGRVDDVVITDENQLIQSSATIKLSAGKKQHVLVRVDISTSDTNRRRI
jgi:tyrosyl-tRNA synthetase